MINIYKPEAPKLIFESPGGKIISEREKNIIIKFLNNSSKTVLEIGSGTGRISHHLIDSGYHVIGLDLDPRNAEKIYSSITPQFKENFSLIIADGQHLPFKNSSFGSIVSFRVLKYFPDYELGIREMSRVVKSRGRLVLEISNIISWESLLRLPRLIVERKIGLPHLFNVWDVIKKLKRHNFEVQSSEATYKIPFGIWTRIRNPYLIKIVLLIHGILLLFPDVFLARGIVYNCMQIEKEDY